jgi:hypothetical protein
MELVSILLVVSTSILFGSLYILKDTIEAYLFGGINCNPKG